MRAAPAVVVILVVASCMAMAFCQEGAKPIILVYPGDSIDWGERLSELITQDGRFDAEVQIVEERGVYETIVNFPRVEAVVICPLERERIAVGDISDLTAAYFLDGGAVVGIGVAVTSRYAATLGPSVFSLSGNRSISARKLEGRRVFEYRRKEVLEAINAQISAEPFYMEGYLAFYSGSSKGDYIEIPANGTRWVLYEGEKNVPLVVAFKSDEGGASVAFPGLTVQVVEGKENYYGHLLEREEFKELFLNGLRWAIDNSPRYERLRDVSAQALEEESNRRADLADEADKLERRIEARRMMRLAILWAVGIAFCAGVALKLLIVRG